MLAIGIPNVLVAALMISSSIPLSARIVPVADDYDWFSYSTLNTTTKARFTGTATAHGNSTINLTGVATVIRGMRAKNIGYNQAFANSAYPQFAISPSIPLIVNSPEVNGAISTRYEVVFDSPLPQGSFLVLIDHDGGEFAHITGLRSDAYLGLISPGDGPAGSAPNASFSLGKWTLAGTGSTSNGLAFFDASGLTGFTLDEGWTNKSGTIPAPGWDNGWAIAVPGNRPPAFGRYACTTPWQTPASLSVTGILAAGTDPDGQSLSVTGAGPVSAEGGTAILREGSILYTPSADFSGVDRFPVAIADPLGATGTGTVTVTVGPAPGTGRGSTTHSPQFTTHPDGTMGLQFKGNPGRAYRIERSIDMIIWTTLATVVASPTGQVAFTDGNPPPKSAFYRVAY